MKSLSLSWTIARRGQAGFSYLWLLIVIAVMGVGMASVLEVHQTTVRREQETELLWVGRQYVAALESYRAATPADSARPGISPQSDPRQYPASLDELLKDPRYPGVKRHLRRIYNDPLTGRADWGVVRHEGRIVAIHSLSTQTPLKRAGFEPAEDGFESAQHHSDWVFATRAAVVAVPAQTAASMTRQ
jgi:type II secretory pathway pseudopilin PulG